MPILRKALKWGVGLGAVYVTYSRGMWEIGAEKGSEYLQEVKKNILPETVEFFEKAPSTEQLRDNALQKYNQSIQGIFGFIGDIPKHANHYSQQLIDQFKS